MGPEAPAQPAPPAPVAAKPAAPAAGDADRPPLKLVRPPQATDHAPADRAATEAWVLATLPRAVAFAAGLLRHDRQAAEDVVHDCYCRLLAKAADYDLPADGARLLFRAIANACIDRHRRRNPVHLSALDADGDGQPVDPPDARAAEPWAAAGHDELRRAVAAGLDRLGPAQRAALELRAAGHSLEEIGAALGVTANNAGVLVHRARQTLAKHVGSLAEG